MCCRACPGYEICRNKGKTSDDDCCTQCPYFDSCMEDSGVQENKSRRPASRRTTKG
ncbi:hypothetical protein HPY86_00270 [candidate division WOR-3 bacterium]|nr:hypothetical protein [candidate division WOR-3 bacterium]